MYGLVQVGVVNFRFTSDRVISGLGHFGSYYNSDFIRFWIGLLLVFGSNEVHLISSVGFDIDLGRLVQILGLGSVFSGLIAS